jgi:hypothetical protein
LIFKFQFNKKLCLKTLVLTHRLTDGERKGDDDRDDGAAANRHLRVVDEHVHELRLEREVGRAARRLNLCRGRERFEEHREDDIDCDGNRDGARNNLVDHYTMCSYFILHRIFLSDNRILRSSRPANVVRFDRKGMGVRHGGWYINVTAIRNNKKRLLAYITRL